MPIPVALVSRNFYFSELEGMFELKRRAVKTPCNYYNSSWPILTVNHKEEFGINDMYISMEECQQLYEGGKESLVGKGKETVLDREVRRSREYSSDLLNFSDKFLKHIEKRVSSSVKKMGAGCLVKMTPHKLIVYGEDDFFSEHMDAVHTPGQTMTAVVIFETEHDGGHLEVDGIPFSGSGIVVFYGDQPHQVHPVTSGYRVVLTLDLEIDYLNLKDIDHKKDVLGKTFSPKSILVIVEQLKKMEVKRFGFFATQRYLEGQQLKGDDARVVEHFRPYIDQNVQRLDLSTDDCRKWYHEDVWNFKNSGPDSGTCMREYMSDEEGEPEDYHQPDIPAKNESIPDNWCPEDEEHVIRDEFCLGDIFQLWSPHLPRLTNYGDTEIHLGNEGFYGEVHQNLFIVMTFR